MVTLYEGAFAKINLTLDVLDKREDGYHDIKSIMQAVSIRDDIEIDVGTGKPWTLTCNIEGVPTDQRNLAWKAAEVYLQTIGKDPEGLAIRITKPLIMQPFCGRLTPITAHRCLFLLWQNWVRRSAAMYLSACFAVLLWQRAGESGCGNCRICRIASLLCVNRSFPPPRLSFTVKLMKPLSVSVRIIRQWKVLCLQVI